VIERVCVVGAGVIGSLYAGHLARVAEVTCLVRREEHARALNQDGLRVSGRHHFLSRLSAATSADELPDPDLVLHCTKTTSLEPTAAALAGRFPEATMMTTQNGLGAEQIVRGHGDWPIVSAVTFMSGTKRSDAEVDYVLDTPTWLGPYEDTPFETVDEIAHLLADAGLKSQALRDVRPAQWSKLIFNATVNGVAALTGLPHDLHFSDPEHFGELVHELIAEGKLVAAAADVELHDDPWEMNVHATKRGSSHYPSMLEDVEAGRPTEIELINGALVREAERLGVEAPLQAALYALVTGREAAYS
jgi:2-dehydropantoate 2-reductase